jgi:hypothetical protein
MSRFSSTFGKRLTAAALLAMTAAVVFPATAGAAPKTNQLSGNVAKGSGVGFNGTVTSDSDGTAVRGAFKVNLSNGGNITVEATCLQVAFGLGGRAGSAGGVVKTSTDGSVEVGSGIIVRAFDSDNPAQPDGIDVFAGPTAPGPNQCGTQLDPLSPVVKGKVTVKISA